MKIALEATSLARQDRTGVAVYGCHLIEQLARVDRENRYVLCYRLSRLRHRRHFFRVPGSGFPVKILQEPLNPLFMRTVDLYHGLDARVYGGGTARKVVTVHDLYAWTRVEEPPRGAAARKRRRLVDLLSHADAVIAVSGSTKQEILRHLPALEEDRIHVIPLGVDGAFGPRRPSEIDPVLCRHGIQVPFVLYVGCMEHRKNLVRLLEAFVRVQQCRGTPLTLVLAGTRGEGAEDVLAAMKEMPAGAHVRCLGYVAREDLPFLYSGAELSVYPSLYEGFGLPVLEAMACGSPVVTSRATSMPEVAGDAALTVDPTRVEELAEAIRALLDSPELRERCRDKGVRRAAAFSWERTARETLDVYRKVHAVSGRGG